MNSIAYNWKELFESDEAKEYFKKIADRREIELSQMGRFYNLPQSVQIEFIENVIDKYDSDEYVKREYKIGREPNTELYFFLFEVASKYGFSSDITTAFSASAYIYLGYKFELLHGQGSVILVNKIKDEKLV